MGKLPGRLFHLHLDLRSDDVLVVSDNGREGVGAKARAYKDMRTGEPIALRLPGFLSRTRQERPLEWRMKVQFGF